MRDCLSEQISVKQTKESELRKRTAADKFLLNVCDIVGDAQRGMQSDKKGQMFDPHQGYVSYKADPDNIFNDIQKEHKKYQEEQLITEDCKLSDSELTEKFFVKAFKTLNLCLETERKNSQGSFKFAKGKSSLFNKEPLKLHKQEAERMERKYQQRIQEMQNFQKIVAKVGAEHIKIFAASDISNASYSIPNDVQLNDDTTTNAASSISSMYSK